MLTFYKRSYPHYFNAKTKRRVSLTYLFKLIDSKVEFEVVSKATGKSIMNYVMRKYNIRKKLDSRKKPKVNLYGPNTPLNETKFNECNSCKRKTPNRFKCSNCWDNIQENYEDDFLYML